ncbi:hypothetical protein ACG0Z6_11720 [Roseateles sp. BYS180W]|uniref:Uncharacterized protein n=1 Tax=Roseateles rivi TaxID=3299028 RepID=A0ABW7FX53_9BURK
MNLNAPPSGKHRAANHATRWRGGGADAFGASTPNDNLRFPDQVFDAETGGTVGVTRAAAPAAVALAKRFNFDGPSPGLAYGNGRVCQVRFDKQPVLRLDYHPYPGTGGEWRLHLNIWSEGVHIPLDPRNLWDGR